MPTFARNGSEFLSFLTGFDERDAFSKPRRLPHPRPRMLPHRPGRREPQWTAQNDTLELVYGVLGRLREWLQDGSGDKPPTAAELLAPVDTPFFEKVRRQLVDAGELESPSAGLKAWPGAGERKPTQEIWSVLQMAVEGLVAEAWIDRLRNQFVQELERSLAVFEERIKKCRTRDGWHDGLDGGVVLYDIFRPNLWKRYRKLYRECSADMERIRKSVNRLRRIEEVLTAENDTRGEASDR